MSLFFADSTDQITLGVQASNQAEATQFSSTTDQVFMRFYTNNFANTGVDNLRTGVVIGSSNYDKSGTALNNLYMGMLTGTSNIQQVVVMQKDRVGINTSRPTASFHVYGSNVYSSWNSLARIEAATGTLGTPAAPWPAFVIDANGNVGVGTETVAGNTMTVKGTLQVDSLQIGSSSGGNSSLITTQGLQPPAGATNLAFNNASLCNITDITMLGSLYTSNTIFANTYNPLNGSTIYYNSANLSNISVIYPSQIQFTNTGTAASPALTFQGNNNTGLFEPAINQLAVATAGAEAFRVDANGNVGIGTQTPGVMLDVANTIRSPNIVGSNLIELFTNISAYRFLYGAKVTVGTIPPNGQVPVTVAFNGNATTYKYTLNITTPGGYNYTSSLRTISTSTENFSSTFTSTGTLSAGTYQINLAANSTGIGAGSYFNSNNIANFTMSASDTIGQPSVSFSTPPPTFSANIIYVSSIPYYANGVTITLPINSLTFTNIYNSSGIDPQTAITITYVLNINGTNFTYANVFTNVLVANNHNNNTLAITLTSTGTSGTLTLPGTVYNINYQSGVTNPLLISGIAYLGASVDETTISAASYAGLSITYVVRLKNASATPLTPNVDTELQAFVGNTASSISTNDGFYSPYTKTIYNNVSQVAPATYYPSYGTVPAGSHNFFTILITASAALGTFVLNFTGANTINYVRIYWVSLGTWYDATVMYNAGGCAASTYTGGTRYPITLPQGSALSGATNIYVNVQFNGSIPLSTFSITNS